MPIPAARHRIGADRDGFLLHTGRDGLAASAGHDLTTEAARWSGELSVGENSVPSALDVRSDMDALVVRSGSGGAQPLTERDKREVQVQARKTLGFDALKVRGNVDIEVNMDLSQPESS